MSKILISGANGFVGANLGRYLEQNGHSVTPLSRNPPAGQTSFAWDDLTAVKNFGFDTYIHLAGKAHDLKNTSNADEYTQVNFGLTKKLFDVFLQSNALTFIYFSSVKAVADTVEDILYEDAAPDPQTPYGKSKLQAEEYLLSQPLPVAKRLFIMRPCMIHGPGNKGNLNLLYKVVKKGIPYPLAAFANQRSFLSIDNLNFIIGSIADNLSVPGGVYNMADDDSLPTTRVIEIIAKTIGSKAKLKHVSPKVVNKMAKVGDALKLPFNSERLKKLTESYVVSNKKIKEALNISKLATSADEGLERTIKSFSSN